MNSVFRPFFLVEKNLGAETGATGGASRPISFLGNENAKAHFCLNDAGFSVLFEHDRNSPH
jgi:hypothetical protein